MAFLTLLRAGAALLALGSVCSPFSQISQSAPAHEIKAAFVFNFTKFVTWPPLPANQPFRICVVADETTKDAIDRVMQNEIILNRKTQTVVPASPEQARSCQVLIVGADAAVRGAPFVAAVRTHPVLTVGDAPAFIDSGGIIQFVTEGTRIRFDVSLTHASRAQLAINARMLRVAREVKGTP
jgi:YfiR/HmsC-like